MARALRRDPADVETLLALTPGPPVPPSHPSASELHDELIELIERLDSADVRAFEGLARGAIQEGLEPPVRAALEDAIALLARILERYDGASIPPPPPPSPDEDGRSFDFGLDTLVRQRPSPGRIADLCFIASYELRNKRDALSRSTQAEDGWSLLATLDSALRRARKSLVAVAVTLCDAEGLERRLDFTSELETSLAVRAAYAALRRVIDEAREPADGELLARLRGVGTRIAMLIGKRVYSQLRVADRHQLRGLQERILVWLRSEPSTPEARVQGRRLWQDLAGFARVIAQISQRQELLEHDAHVVHVACAALYGSAPKAGVPEGLFERLRALSGLDDEIDQLLTNATRDASAWRAPLERCRARFEQRRAVQQPAAEPIAWEELG